MYPASQISGGEPGQVPGIESRIFQAATVVPKAVDEDGQWGLEVVPELKVRGARRDILSLMSFHEISYSLEFWWT